MGSEGNEESGVSVPELQRQLQEKNEIIHKLKTVLQHHGISAEGDGINDMLTKFMSIAGNKFTSPSCEVRLDDVGYVIDGIDQSNSGGKQSLLTPILQLPSKFLAKRVRTTAITGIDLVIKPGTLTLVLGAPGSGKSTLLKAIAGLLPNNKTHILEGKITYDGLSSNTPGDSFHVPKIVSYVSQTDTHLPTLTVEETMSFALNCMTGGRPEHSVMSQTGSGVTTDPDMIGQVYKLLSMYVEVQLENFGLSRVKGTFVGNGGNIRGVSGGERRRVTSAEMMCCGRLVQCMDEISNGLDSAAIFDIISSFRALSRLGNSFVVSLLQPTPDVYELFDNIVVLDGGKLVFSGPRTEVLKYFEQLGFYQPRHTDVADFLLEVCTPNGSKYTSRPVGESKPNVVTTTATNAGAAGADSEGRRTTLPPIVAPEPTQVLTTIDPSAVPKSLDQFATLFKSSEVHAKYTMALLRAPSSTSVHWHPYAKREFENPWSMYFWACLSREQILMRRDLLFGPARMAQGVFMGLLLGTLFWQIVDTDYMTRFGLIFFVMALASMGSMPMLPGLVEMRDVFYRQRDSGFYPTSAYVAASFCAELPVILISNVVMLSLLYWMAGLTADGGGKHFLVAIIISISAATSIGMSLRVIATVSKDEGQAQVFAAVFVMVMVMFSGFVAEAAIPDYLVWLFDVNPMAYTFKALALNEFKSDKFQSEPTCPSQNSPVPCGDVYLMAYGFTTDESKIWPSVIFLWFWFVLSLLVNTMFLHYFRVQKAGAVTVTAAASAAASPAEKYSSVVTPLPSGGGGGKEGLEGVAMTSSIPFKPVRLSWENLTYAVDLPRKKGGSSGRLQLLGGINGYARPGTITALMGSGGAGKTTLLNVLAGRHKGGRLTGDILVNSYPKSEQSFARVSGFVGQLDSNEQTATVREALQFSARMRLPASVSRGERLQFVEECAALLGLGGEIEEMVVSALNTEQRKRLTIGVELVANPSVLFLDKPTNGLDAASSQVVMKSIRALALSGRSVVCTIHASSASLFQLFDNLLLLQRGGRTAYFGPLGPDAGTLTDYLRSLPGMEPIKDGENPANYMLTCLATGSLGVFPEAYSKSVIAGDASTSLTRLREHRTSAPEVAFTSSYALPLSTQLRELTRRRFVSYWRNPGYNLTRLLVQGVLGLMFGAVYYGQELVMMSDVTSRISMIFMTQIFTGFIAMMPAIPVMASERAVYAREKQSRMYATSVYAATLGLVELPYLLVGSGMFVNVAYWMIGMSDDTVNFFMFWIYICLTISLFTFVGQLLACVAPDAQTAGVCGVGLANFWCLFNGLFIPFASIPRAYRILYHICPLRYVFEGMVVTQFESEAMTMVMTPFGPIPAQMFVMQMMFPNFDYDDRWVMVLVLVGFVVGFYLLTLAALLRR